MWMTGPESVDASGVAMSAADFFARLEQFDRQATRGVCFTGRYRCRYVCWGAGPPLVIVHGLVDQARSFGVMMSALVHRFTCVAYELPNGRDDGARLGCYRHADLVADLLALLDHLGLEQVAVLGSSFGSTIALRAMLDAPNRITHGVLQGGFARRPLKPLELALARLARPWPGRLGDVPGRLTLLHWLNRPAFVAADPAVFDFFKRSNADAPIHAVAQRALMLHRLDLRPLLPAIRQPLLLIGGDRDAIVPKPCELELLAALPKARRVEIPRCGHYPQFTHPLVMARSTEDFLTSTA